MNQVSFSETSAPPNPFEDQLHLYARENPSDATQIQLVFLTSQGEVVILGTGDDSAVVSAANILTLNWME
jgi:hypothetical protein